MALEFPQLASLDDLATYVKAHASEARKCWRLTPDGRCLVDYPLLGTPPPFQPRVCRYRSPDGTVCGVGGHNARTHLATTSLSTKALTHAVWIIRNMEVLGVHHLRRHVQVLIQVLCSLQERRQHYRVDDAADIRSILLMYQRVVQWYHQSKPKRDSTSHIERRRQRSSIHTLNHLLLLFQRRDPVLEPGIVLAGVARPNLVVFLFPTCKQTLHQLCIAAFANQDVSIVRKVANGHLRTCQGGGGGGADDDTRRNCTCRGSFLKVPRIDMDVVCCHRCGIPGHNQASCQARTPATHVAIALATLLDPYKAPRISAKACHLTLFHCYDVLVAMLYQWVHHPTTPTTPWHIHGVPRLTALTNANAHPILLLRLYNHALASLKACPRVGPGMLVIHRPDHLMLDAAHRYDDGDDDEDDDAANNQREAKSVSSTLKRVIQDFQDEDLDQYRPLPLEKRSFLTDMVQTTKTADPRIAAEIAKFAFDDILF